MAPRITFIGGGSNQWTPMLVTDIVNTPSLHEAEIVLEDINPAPLPKMASLVEHLARLRGIPMTVRYTTDQRAALSYNQNLWIGHLFEGAAYLPR